MENKKKPEKVCKSIYLKPSIWNRIQQYAKKQDRTKSKIIEFAVQIFLDSRGE